jgi:general secretion pathway protein G
MTTIRRWPLYLAAFIAVILGPPVPVARRTPSLRGKAVVKLQELSNALALFRLDVGRFPSTAEGLQSLVLDLEIRNWAGPYLTKGLPDDPWGRPYEYRAIGKEDFCVSSWGADGRRGGNGEAEDISIEYK